MAISFELTFLLRKWLVEKLKIRHYFEKTDFFHFLNGAILRKIRKKNNKNEHKLFDGIYENETSQNLKIRITHKIVRPFAFICHQYGPNLTFGSMVLSAVEKYTFRETPCSWIWMCNLRQKIISAISCLSKHLFPKDIQLLIQING